jgi:hypothetical protein
MTEAEYRALPAINATAIKAGRQSMAHMHQAMTGGGRADTPTLRWGRLVHMAVLEPVRLATLPVWDGDRRGKAWLEFRDAHDGKEILTAAEVDRLLAVSQAFTESGASRLVAGGRHEHAIAWEGVTPDGHAIGACKALVDSWARPVMVEYKTTRNLATRAFLAQCEALGYLLAAGWYATGLRTAERLTDWPSTYLIAQESDAPHCVAVYEITAAQLEAGYAEAAEIARRYRAHELTGRFPGPYDGMILPYERPMWAVGGDIEDGDNDEMEG